jgi:hypothetical protein
VAGAVEILLPYGGGFSVDSRGDLVLVQDMPGNPAATIQRLVQLIQTSPRLRDPGSGNFIGRADDLFNPDYGAGAAQDVGQLGTQGVLADLVSRIQAGIAIDPFIAAYPAPVVTAVNSTPGTILVTVSCTAVTGEPVAIPTQTLQNFS